MTACRDRTRSITLVSALVHDALIRGNAPGLTWAATERLRSWHDALSLYPQTTGRLHRRSGLDALPAGYCCLGVYCVLNALPEHTPVWAEPDVGYRFPDGSTSEVALAPGVLATWLQRDDLEALNEFQQLLMYCNDSLPDGHFGAVQAILCSCIEQRSLPTREASIRILATLRLLAQHDLDLDTAYTPPRVAGVPE